jgi:hypothetical protein
MATGISNYLANKWLDALGNATAFSVTTAYVKLHTGDPGAAGTSNAAIASDADLTWTNIAGSEDATHFTAWDNATTGNFLFSGTITGNPYTAGDTYTIASGALNVSLTIAS